MPKQGMGQAEGGGSSRQAVVGIQTLRLHIVNCNRGKREGGETRGVCVCLWGAGLGVVPQGQGSQDSSGYPSPSRVPAEASQAPRGPERAGWLSSHSHWIL